MAQDPRAIEAWLNSLPGAAKLPFRPSPAALYTVGKLYDGLSLEDPASLSDAWDTRVFRWTLESRGKPPLGAAETVATRLHDARMDRLVRDYLDHRRAVTVGFMGGHNVLRTDPVYETVARMARELRRLGFKIVTGGGPGLMEAANFGALLAPHDEDHFVAALEALGHAPVYGSSPDPAVAKRQTQAWVHSAALVRRNLLGRWDGRPKTGGDSLGIPTWYYGSEPPNLFASVSGKYFENSLREDGLVSVANGGLVFGKGSAGTVQEVFQNASYNYYRGDGVEATPMVFLGVDFWNPSPAAGPSRDPRRIPVFPLVQKLAADARPPFTAQVILSDDPAEIIKFLRSQNGARLKARRADIRLRQVNSPRPQRRLGFDLER